VFVIVDPKSQASFLHRRPEIFGRCSRHAHCEIVEHHAATTVPRSGNQTSMETEIGPVASEATRARSCVPLDANCDLARYLSISFSEKWIPLSRPMLRPNTSVDGVF